MKANMGGLDRGIRVIFGIAVLAVGLVAGLAAPWNYIADGVGVVLILTAGIKFCPAYMVIGANTCSTCEKKG